MIDDHEEIPTPLGPVKMPPIESFRPIYCKHCGEQVGGTLLEQSEFPGCACPFCDGEGGTTTPPV